METFQYEVIKERLDLIVQLLSEIKEQNGTKKPTKSEPDNTAI